MRLKYCCLGPTPLEGLPLPAASLGDPSPTGPAESAPQQVSALVTSMGFGTRQIWAGDLALAVAGCVTLRKPLPPLSLSLLFYKKGMVIDSVNRKTELMHGNP